MYAFYKKSFISVLIRYTSVGIKGEPECESAMFTLTKK